jgi:Uncharacterised nucleotidyltransferase
VVLLKGAAYAMADQPAALGRLFGDIDLLVPRAQLAEVESRLMLAGWTSNADAYDQRYYRDWMHELPPLTHQVRGTAVDVHHNILPPVSRRAPDADLLLARSEPIVGTPLRRLTLVDQILHSATHLFHEGSFGNLLRDLCDLDALFRELRARGGEWARLRERASELGLSLDLALASHHARRALGTELPAELLEGARSDSGVGRLRWAWLDHAYGVAFRPLPARRSAGARLSLFMLYLRSHALRMPAAQLAWHLGRKLLLRFVSQPSAS